MMITFEPMTILANLAMKLTVTPGVFLLDTRMPVTISVTARNLRKSTVPCCQCDTVQLILLTDYRTFGKCISSVFIKCI